MDKGLFADLQGEHWAMEARALEAFMLKLAAIDPTPDQVAAFGRSDSEQARKSRMEISNGVASVPVTGVLVKKVPWYFSFFGIDATAYGEIEADVARALADDSVTSIRLMVDSPGGQVAGVKEASDAIAAARALKPVSAHIDDIGASGAYWLASQAGKVSASPNALVGSIGVYSAYVDSSKAAENEGYKVHVVSSGPHKGMGVPGSPITADQLAAMQQVIDGMAANFVQDVARGRGRGADQVTKWADGRVWISREALQNGLIDSVTSGKSSSRTGVPSAAASETLSEEGNMDPKKDAAGADAQAAVDKAASDARAAERQRLQDLKAAFADDQAFAFEQYEKGASVDQAKVAYCEVLRAKQKTLLVENETLKKGSRAAGADPIRTAEAGAAGAADGEDRFIAAARQHQADQRARGVQVNLFQAMSAVIRQQPALYQEHLERTDARRVEIASRKKVMGIK